MGLSDKQAAFLCSEEAASVFKAEWLRADRLNASEHHPNSRVAAGLAAVAERMREIHG